MQIINISFVKALTLLCASGVTQCVNRNGKLFRVYYCIKGYTGVTVLIQSNYVHYDTFKKYYCRLFGESLFRKYYYNI